MCTTQDIRRRRTGRERHVKRLPLDSPRRCRHLTIADSGNHVLRRLTSPRTSLRQSQAVTLPASVATERLPPLECSLSRLRRFMILRKSSSSPMRGSNRVRRVVLHPTKLNATLTYAGASSVDITFTATYSGLSFGIAPTGTVTFLNGSASLGMGTVAAATDGLVMSPPLPRHRRRPMPQPSRRSTAEMCITPPLRPRLRSSS